MKFVALFALVASASALTGVVLDGTCPDLKAVENFNINSYKGLWYKISMLNNMKEKDGKCSQAEYTVEGDTVKVHNAHIINGVQYYVDGIAKFAPDANKAAKFIASFTFGDRVTTYAKSVVATDYKNYAIAYVCKYDEVKKTHENTAWILSRTKKLEGDAKTAVDNYLKENAKELDSTKFIQTDFSDEACKFTSTKPIAVKPTEP